MAGKLNPNDSLDLVELVMELEAEFDISIPDDIADEIRTVEDAIRYIRQHPREGASGEPGGGGGSD